MEHAIANDTDYLYLLSSGTPSKPLIPTSSTLPPQFLHLPLTSPSYSGSRSIHKTNIKSLFIKSSSDNRNMSASAPRETPAVEDTLKKRPGCCCCCYHYNKFDIAFAVFRYLEIALGVWTIALCVTKQLSTGTRDLFNLRRLAYTCGPLIPLGVLSIVSGVLISGMGCCTKQAGVRFPLNRPRL
jgi:hypothetical protein